MHLRHNAGIVFQDTIETVRKVKLLLESQGIHATVIPLPFYSQRDSGPDTGFTPALRYGQLVVNGEDCIRALAVLAKHRDTIDQWSGFPSVTTGVDDAMLGPACPACGTSLDSEDEICRGCGLRLSDARGLE